MTCFSRTTGAVAVCGVVFVALVAGSDVLGLGEPNDVSVVAELVGDTTILLTVHNDGPDPVFWTVTCDEGRQRLVASWWLESYPDLCFLVDLDIGQDTIRAGEEHTRDPIVSSLEHW